MLTGRSEEEWRWLVRETEAEEEKEPADRQTRRKGAVKGPADNGFVDLYKHTIVHLSGLQQLQEVSLGLSSWIWTFETGNNKIKTFKTGNTKN